jgi:hypothetical protein
MTKLKRTRPGITMLPEVIELGKKKASKVGLSFSRWLELLIKNSK